MLKPGSPARSPDLLRAAEQVQTLRELGELLRQLRRLHARRRRETPLTVRELAARSGYATGAISQYLSGRTLPQTDRFDVLTGLLGADPVEQRALATARDRVEEHRRLGGRPSRLPY
jgi:transcriptional regulator with XRE-family HTH domain